MGSVMAELSAVRASGFRQSVQFGFSGKLGVGLYFAVKGAKMSFVISLGMGQNFAKISKFR